LNGEFVLQDYKRAAELICASADQGDANGQFNCGLMYSEGKGVAQDDARAVDYWQQAAEANHVAAINYIGQAYQSGTGLAQDPMAAFEQFQITAAAGNPMGLHEVAKAYASGEGVERDLVKAHGFANLAAVRGLEEARVLRDEIAGQLDAASLETAQAFARDWKAVPIDQAG
jgi:TPR repeat protein